MRLLQNASAAPHACVAHAKAQLLDKKIRAHLARENPWQTRLHHEAEQCLQTTVLNTLRTTKCPCFSNSQLFSCHATAMGRVASYPQLKPTVRDISSSCFTPKGGAQALQKYAGPWFCNISWIAEASLRCR
eukprot:826755-Amphidinium_carterae.1